MLTFEDALLDFHEFLADDVAFLFGIDSAFERVQELFRRRFHLEGAARPAPQIECGRIQFRLPASGPYRRRRRGLGPVPSAFRHSVYATVESTPPLTKKNTFRSPAVARICSSSAWIWPGGIPVLLAAANIEKKIRQDMRPARRVHHFRMELYRKQPRSGADMAATAHVLVLARVENRRGSGHQVAMAHPDLLRGLDASHQEAIVGREVRAGRIRILRESLFRLAHPANAPSVAGRNRFREWGCRRGASADRWSGCRDRRRWRVRRK